MPTYQLKCDTCDHVFTDVHKMSEPHPPCPECGKEVQVYMTKPPAAIVTGNRRAMRDERSAMRAL